MCGAWFYGYYVSTMGCRSSFPCWSVVGGQRLSSIPVFRRRHDTLAMMTSEPSHQRSTRRSWTDGLGRAVRRQQGTFFRLYTVSIFILPAHTTRFFFFFFFFSIRFIIIPVAPASPLEIHPPPTHRYSLSPSSISFPMYPRARLVTHVIVHHHPTFFPSSAYRFH